MGTRPVSKDPQATDEDLARAARAGERRAFEELVARLHGPLFDFLRMRTGSEPDAEELAQEAFLRAWSQLARYDPARSFKAWLFTLAKRLAVSRHRRLLRGDGAREVGDEALGDVAGGEDPQGLASRREESSGLWALAARVLSAEQRSALWLRYAEDLSVAEIAGVLGRPRVTVRVVLFRARERLAWHLAPHAESVGARPALVSVEETGGRS